jgi:hypothetical protein
MIDLLICILAQLLLSIGAIALVGLTIGWLNRTFCRQFGNYSRTVLIVTGIIGTSIHELGHAFFCVIFRHKIQEMKLFIPNPRDDTLGYVSHTYNHNSFYQRVGNFFIGVGPILFGSGVLALLMWLLIPHVFHSYIQHLEAFVNAASNGNLGRLPALAFSAAGDFFALSNLDDVRWWLYVVLACFIAIHVDLSPPDIAGAKPGALLFAIVVVVPNIVLALFGNGALSGYNRIFLTGCLFVTGIMFLCLFFSGIATLTAVSIGHLLHSRRSTRRRRR